MITIERTHQDGSIYLDIDQTTYHHMVEMYNEAMHKEMMDHGDDYVATGAALMNTFEFFVNVFMFDNKCIRPIREPNRKKREG